MEQVETLKEMIDEESYPYFSDTRLEKELARDKTIEQIARELCIVKSGIEEIKLGDIVIPSPKEHFLVLASKYRKSHTGSVVRADE